jgi:hypothetical protein
MKATVLSIKHEFRATLMQHFSKRPTPANAFTYQRSKVTAASGLRVLVHLIFIAFATSIACSSEVAIPNINLLGKQSVDAAMPALSGKSQSIQPNAIEIELASGTVISIKATYLKAVETTNIITSVSQLIGVSGENMGNGVYVWRNTEKLASAMLVQDKKNTTVLIRHLGKKPGKAETQ